MYLEPQNQVSCGKCYNGDINGNRRDTEEIHSERWQLWQISGRETGWSGVVKDRSDWFQEMEMNVKIFQKLQVMIIILMAGGIGEEDGIYHLGA